jgi:hypothetical protein
MTIMRAPAFFCGLFLCTLAADTLARGVRTPAPADQGEDVGGYAVVGSTRTAADPEWAKVVAALKKKHHAVIVTYSGSPQHWLAPLRAVFPK